MSDKIVYVLPKRGQMTLIKKQQETPPLNEA